MKNLILYLIITALSIVLIIVGYKWYQDGQKLDKLESSKDDVAKQILTGAKEIKRAVNAKGAESVLLDITGNHTSVNNSNKTDIPDIVDTAALALDIRTKQLKEVTNIVALYKAENLQLKAQLDSNHHTYYTYDANGLKLKLTPPYDTAKLATADFIGTLGITIAQGYKRKWFLGKEKTLMNVTSDSKFFTIDHVNYIGFDKDPVMFNVEGQATASFNSSIGVGVGPGVKIRLGKLELGGNYQYFQQERSWLYGATAAYKIFGF